MTERLELNALDVARVRVGPTLGPLPEALLALAALKERSTSTGRRQRLVELQRQTSSRDRALASFLWLSPRAGLDLFTLTGPTSTIGDGRDAVLDAPAEHVAAEMWSGHRHVPTRADRACCRPSTAGCCRTDDRSGATGPLDRFGARAAVGRHHPQAVTSLGGRGLVVTPSFFAPEPAVFVPAGARDPALLIITVRPPGLALPPTAGRTARHGADCSGQPARRSWWPSAAGLGPPPKLSADLGIALSGASQHAAVLRRAGLISTTRDGGRVLHAVTELGIALLKQVSA